MSRQPSHVPVGTVTFVLLSALFLVAAACGSDRGGPESSGSRASGGSEEPPQVRCPPGSPDCLAWDDFDATPGGPIVRSSSGHVWATWGLRCPDCHPAFETHSSRATMAPGSDKVSTWLATLDTENATGITVSAMISLSPTPLRANVGIVALFSDRMNHLGCKVEVSAGHPDGLLAIGDERHGATTSLLAERDDVGFVSGGTYHLRLRVPSSLASTPVTCVASTEGIRLARVAYQLTAANIAAYGSGTSQGLRIKIFDDEDDGRSTWDDFEVSRVS